jgi:hypothetical protein
MTSELSCWEKGDDVKTGRNEHMRSTPRISKVLLLSFIGTSSCQYTTLNFPLLELSKSYAEMRMSGASIDRSVRCYKTYMVVNDGLIEEKKCPGLVDLSVK